MQTMGPIPILCINVNFIIDTMLKFYANAHANINIDAQCEQTLMNGYLCLCLCHYWYNAKLDANAYANVDVDAQCERILTRIYLAKNIQSNAELK